MVPFQSWLSPPIGHATRRQTLLENRKYALSAAKQFLEAKHRLQSQQQLQCGEAGCMTLHDNESFDCFGVQYNTVFDCSVVGTCAMQEQTVDAIVDDPVRRILGDMAGEDAEILEHRVKDTERGQWSHHVVRLDGGDGVEYASNFVVYEDRSEDHAVLVLDSVLADELYPLETQPRRCTQTVDWHGA